MSDKQAQLDYLKERMLQSPCSSMYEAAQQIVFGSGDPDAKMVFVGEAPGDEEDQTGEPFGGPAGGLLDTIMGRVAVSREQIYLTNIMKWRPPENQNPEPSEIEASTPYLHAQIAILQPKVLVAIGRFAGNVLSGTTNREMGDLRKDESLLYRKGSLEIPVVAIYPPAYLMQHTQNKGAFHVTVRDLQRAIRILRAE